MNSIKIFKQIIALILVSQVIISCDLGYKKEDNKVYYKYWNSGMGIETRTFQIPKADYNINKIQLLEYLWAKAGNVLIHGKDTLILNDINEVVVVDEDWGKTKKSVIHWNEIVPNAKPETFKFDN